MRTRREILKQVLLLMTAGAARRALAQSVPQVQSRRVSVPLVDASGTVVSRYNASSKYMLENLGAGVSLDVALIPGGSFLMGTASNPGHPEESPIHTVQVRPFGLGTNPVTIGQWRQVATFPKVSMGLHIPARGALPLDVENTLPIDAVLWAEAVEFCARLKNVSGRPYRLPSEAEWEYACRAGTTTLYHFGDGISLDVANYNDGLTRPITLTPAGSKQAPNRFGLNDMHGNVFEWCSDWWHGSYVGAPADGSSWNYSGDSATRVPRGGSFIATSDLARSAARLHWFMNSTASGFGLRVALDLPGGSADPLLAFPGIVNLASQRPGPANSSPDTTPRVSPGQLVSIQGQFGISNSASISLDGQGIATTALVGVRVLFNDFPAPLVLVSATEIRAVVPYDVSGLSTVWVAVESQGQTSLPLSVHVLDASPGIFTVDSSGTGQAASVNEDGTQNGENNPARKGTMITLFATGEGQTSPPGVNGKVATAPLPAPILDVQLWIGGTPAHIEYVGGAPGEIAGVLQINARIPADLLPGPESVVLRIGQASSPPVTVFVG